MSIRARSFRYLPVLLALAVFALWARPSAAQERSSDLPRVSPNATVSQTIGVTQVEITYGRPQVRGRTIFGDLVAYDTVWRTGANEATTISFSTPVQIEGKPLEAGTYGLFTIPGTETWTIVFNSEANQWGAYNYDESKDVLQVEVTPESAPMQEMMTFAFENVTDTSATAVLHWAEVRVPFSITVDTPEILRERATAAVQNADDWRVPFQYAAYAQQRDVMTEAALQWIDRSIELERNFNNLAVKAHLQADAGQFAQAAQTAEEALAQAESMDEPPQGVDRLRQQVETWKTKS